jgi:hypothetical protein
MVCKPTGNDAIKSKFKSQNSKMQAAKLTPKTEVIGYKYAF